MTIEYTLLKNKTPVRLNCPKCGAGFTKENAFMRGMVQSSWRFLFRLPYCVVICHACKQMVDWEKP